MPSGWWSRTQVQQHRREPEHRVRDLSGSERDVGRQREERSVRERVPVDQHQLRHVVQPMDESRDVSGEPRRIGRRSSGCATRRSASLRGDVLDGAAAPAIRTCCVRIVKHDRAGLGQPRAASGARSAATAPRAGSPTSATADGSGANSSPRLVDRPVPALHHRRRPQPIEERVDLLRELVLVARYRPVDRRGRRPILSAQAANGRGSTRTPPPAPAARPRPAAGRTDPPARSRPRPRR